MVRKRVGAAPEASKTGFRSVVVTPVESSDALAFATIGPDHDVWLGASIVRGEDIDARFVRLRPPHSASDEIVALVIKQLKILGFVVQPVQRQAPEVVTAIAAPQKHESAREAVNALIEEMHSHDRKALRTLVDATMAVVGL